MRHRPAARGFTLVEMLIALAILAAMLVAAFGGLRVAMGAWDQGEERAEAHQHLRAVALILGRAIGAAYPYRGARGAAPELSVLFTGTEQRLELVTREAPFPGGAPIAFTALVIGVETGDGPALVVRQRPLPNREPFTDAPLALRDPAVQRIEFAYLNASGAWQDAWDATQDKGLPRAVRVTLAMARRGRVETLPPLTVPLHPVVIAQ